MKKYSKEWKEETGKWVQDHKNEKWGRFYKIHYIHAGTEYSTGEYLSRKDAEADMRNIG